MADQRVQARDHTLKGHAAAQCSVSQGVKDKSYNLTFPSLSVGSPLHLQGLSKDFANCAPGYGAEVRSRSKPRWLQRSIPDSRPGPEVPDGRSSLRESGRDLVPFDPSPGTGTRPSSSADIPAARATGTCKSWGLPPLEVSLQSYPSCPAAIPSPRTPPEVVIPLRLPGAGRQPDNTRPREHGGTLKVGQTALTARARELRTHRPAPLGP